MRLACLTTVAPGRTLARQCAAIAAAGCTGVETIIFPTTPLTAWVKEFRQAAADNGLTPAVVILGGLALYRPGGLGWIHEAVAALAEVGAAALITPEYRVQEPLPLFPPFPAPAPDEAAHVTAATLALAQQCAAHRVPLYLEPITQFEGRFWQTLAQVAALCAHVAAGTATDTATDTATGAAADTATYTATDTATGAAADTAAEIGIVADFHNMNITEAQPQMAIAHAGKWIKHVHLADNNRRLPGEGHIDFSGGVQALRTCGYHGWFSYECAVAADDFSSRLQSNIAYLRSL